MKEKLTLSIDKETKDKAKACMNISEEVENILKEKTLDERITEVIKEGNYVVALMPGSWLVYELSNDKRINLTFHSTLSQAIVQLSKRLFRDSVLNACNEGVIDMKKLIELVNKHHKYIIELVRGL